MKTEEIGWALVQLGCGITNENKILDNTAGIEFYKKLGFETKENEPIFRIFCSNKSKLEKVATMLSSTVVIGKHYKEKPLIYY